MGMPTDQGHRARFPGRAGNGRRSLTLGGLVSRCQCRPSATASYSRSGGENRNISRQHIPSLQPGQEVQAGSWGLTVASA